MKDAEFHVILNNPTYGINEELIALQNDAHDNLALTLPSEKAYNPIMMAPELYRNTMLFDIFAGVQLRSGRRKTNCADIFNRVIPQPLK
jgi:hypothetical protein